GGTFECVPVARLTGTDVLGILHTGSSGTSGIGWGWAAPGVTRVKMTLSNGQTVDVAPVGVGNESLFAFWAGSGTGVSWAAYDATGKETDHGVSR
ncbi:MAG TPA: hypothetical protein VHF26_10180, partial [Trebonia sp.]|nr:hypothetical protein [Trebonia sp.]